LRPISAPEKHLYRPFSSNIPALNAKSILENMTVDKLRNIGNTTSASQIGPNIVAVEEPWHSSILSMERVLSAMPAPKKRKAKKKKPDSPPIEEEKKEADDGSPPPTGKKKKKGKKRPAKVLELPKPALPDPRGRPTDVHSTISGGTAWKNAVDISSKLSAGVLTTIKYYDRSEVFD